MLVGLLVVNNTRNNTNVHKPFSSSITTILENLHFCIPIFVHVCIIYALCRSDLSIKVTSRSDVGEIAGVAEVTNSYKKRIQGE